ncbi:MAG: NADH:ubiquinone reductase (Na(+)-transporting) subunit B [bacterium]|nr:NADH:ubiquinone reductase (Na(+)-transporting) subunit B [bacterium]
MNWLVRFKHLFDKGGKFERLYPVYEMLFSLLWVSPEKTTSGSHIRDHYDIKRMMVTVIIALMPVAAFGVYNTGYQHFLSMGQSAGIFDCVLKGTLLTVPVFIVAYGVGGFWELVFAVVRKHEINEGFLVTGFIIPLILPPDVPIWQIVLATSFGVIIGKEVFGGTGMNIFNPALVTRAFLFFAYPASMSGDEVWTAAGDKVVDSYTMATPLSYLSALPEKTPGDVVTLLADRGYDFWNMFLGLIPGSVGETSAVIIMVMGIYLMMVGVASWRIMLSVFAGGYLMGLLLNLLAPSPGSLLAIPAHYHLVMGGFAFGAVFMATDPVSSAATNTGKYIYGFFIGVLAVLVRSLNPAYPEGMMLAILFMNAFAPLIDHVAVWRNTKRRLARASE